MSGRMNTDTLGHQCSYVQRCYVHVRSFTPYVWTLRADMMLYLRSVADARGHQTGKKSVVAVSTYYLKLKCTKNTYTKLIVLLPFTVTKITSQ